MSVPFVRYMHVLYSWFSTPSPHISASHFRHSHPLYGKMKREKVFAWLQQVPLIRLSVSLTMSFIRGQFSYQRVMSSSSYRYIHMSFTTRSQLHINVDINLLQQYTWYKTCFNMLCLCRRKILMLQFALYIELLHPLKR